MCEVTQNRGYGWQGWMDLPAPHPLTATGEWIDLSHPIDADVPRIPIFDAPEIRLLRALPQDLLNVTEFRMPVHVGTHLDSPWHFFLDGPRQGEVPIERMCGRAAVARIDAGEDHVISAAMLDAAAAHAAPGDILILDTGWHRRVGAPEYDAAHPCLDTGAAEWMVARRIKLVACDFPTPDAPVARRGSDFDYPVHRALLSRGVLIAEHLTNLRALTGRFVEANCACINLAEADGAPARIMAREIAE